MCYIAIPLHGNRLMRQLTHSVVLGISKVQSF